MSYDIKTLSFNTIEECEKFSDDWAAYVVDLTNNELCTYIKNNKDYNYHCLIKKTHYDLVKFIQKSKKNLQLYNDVVLEMFLLSSPK